jgi:hypothetical protein
MPLIFVNAWTPGVPEIYTDPANDVYRGTTIDYLGSWTKITDPVVDLRTISIGNGMTTGEIEITVGGGLSSLAGDEYLIYYVMVNTSTDTFQSAVFTYFGGVWVCAVIAMWDNVPTSDTPIVSVTDTTIQIAAYLTFFDIDNGTVTAYAVRYVSLVPPVALNIDFYPDSAFIENASEQPGGAGVTDLMWLWILLAVIAIVIVVIIIVVLKSGGNDKVSAKKLKSRTNNKGRKNGRK